MEFVNDHDQARWRIDHITDIGSMDSGGQLFTACQFGFQRTQRAYGMRQIQIAYAAHGMRQPFEFAERGTAFEIQKHEIQMLRPVHRGERQTPALQQHGFAGTSGAGHQSMRPLTVQIEPQRLASGHADRHRKVKGFKPMAHNGAPWQACEVQQRFYRLRRRMTEVCGAVIGVVRDTDIDRCLLRGGSLLRTRRRGERQQQGHETGEYAWRDHGGEQPLPVQQQYDHHQCLRDHRARRGKHGQAGAQWRRAQTVLRPGYGGCRMGGMSLRIVLL